ncbi:uncharacterized protein LOC116265716 [Nymphaea colorata]|nr:uncharacterized protein LOC116265716 [Nymphaea colorata]XP_031502398.1 uncharacterized protein LOC116265716 [Nymphaea colorata]XP_031502399.1 uncharacterized protein LOC116265716 [Nymphaea colorata]
METEETFADAHEHFSDDYLSKSFLNVDVALARDDGIDSDEQDLAERVRGDSPELFASSELCSSSYQVDSSCTNFDENIQNESTTNPVVGEAEEVSTYCGNTYGASSGNTREGSITNQFVGRPRSCNCINTMIYRDCKACSCSASAETKVLDYLTVSAPLNIICRASISFKDPVEFKTKMEFLFGSSKFQKQTKNSNRLNSLMLHNMIMADSDDSNRPKSVKISPVGQWVINAVNGNGKVASILRSPLLIQLGDQVKNIVPDRLTSTEDRSTSCSDSDSFPLEICGTSSHAPEAASVGDRYDSDITRQEFSDGVIFSCSSSKTADSCQSSSCLSFFRGVLQCSWEGGVPHFIFSLDDKGKVYGAKPWRIESSKDKSLDWIYLFYNKGRGHKQINGIDHISDIVGKMKVSSLLSLDCDNVNQLRFETEYVLFGVSARCHEEFRQDMSPVNMDGKKNKGMQKIVSDLFKASHQSKPRTITKSVLSSSNNDDHSQTGSRSKGTDFNHLNAENLLMNQLIPNLELAAVVVKGCLNHRNNQESAFGGWGLKFLKEREVGNSNEPVERSKGKSTANITVLVPEDFHGGPMTRNGGPSSLIERWRSGGGCDCGGWDLGCPLKVLDDRSCEGTNMNEAESQEECKSTDLFVKGNREDLPVLRMVNVHEGLYFIHFQSTLSALQCFSIGIAIIHSQSPSLFSKMYNK